MYLISKNYYVFRMGVNYKKELKIKNTKFIDYSKNYRSDFLDIYLAYRCNLVISSDTGWDIVPSYFFKTNFIYKCCSLSRMQTLSKKFSIFDKKLL